MERWVAGGVLVVVWGVASTVLAHDRLGTCAGVGLTFGRPAVAEWTDWIGVGGGMTHVGHADRRGVFALRVGGGVDFSIARFGARDGYGGEQELRMGPWIGAETTFHMLTIEGGLMLDLGQAYHAKWGNFTLRVGAGAQQMDDRWTPATSFTLMWGVRSVRGRYSEGGGCVVGDTVEVTHNGEPPRSHAHASGFRLFGTTRVDLDGRVALIFGIEIEPTFLLPPYSGRRLLGTNPN